MTWFRMAVFSIPYPLRTSIIVLTVLSTLLFFLIHESDHPSHFAPPLSRSLLSTLSPKSCSSLHSNPYSALHHCFFDKNPNFSIPILALLILFYFYFLIKTAQDRFSIVVTKLCYLLDLTPSTGAVTLLALGNGAPDVFASVAAVRGGHAKTGLGAILSAGTFVSAFVVGLVAIHAGPFGLDPSTFVRDVMFYMISASFMFYVYLSGEIFLWQAVGFVSFYAFFVGFVFWMDLGRGRRREKSGEREIEKGLVAVEKEYGVEEAVVGNVEGEKRDSAFWNDLPKVSKLWEAPVSILLKLTIPQTEHSEWSRFYLSSNIALCPMALLYSLNSFIPLDHPIIFLLPRVHFPIWFAVLSASSSLAVLHFILEPETPKTESTRVVLLAFAMSVFWISTVAGELLSCLAAIGAILELPPAILGLTVLAWGNSVGDLVADVAVAKAGQPAMAMAGCFVGPMFNMLVGLGTGLAIQTAGVYPEAFELGFYMGIVIAFVFLLLSLMGSLLVITWCRFRVPRFWGFCLVCLYIVFMAVSILIAKFSG